MEINLWGFLSICVIFGGSIAILSMYFSYKKAMKKLDNKAD